MADASVFLRKRKDKVKQRVPSTRPRSHLPHGPSSSSGGATIGLASDSASTSTSTSPGAAPGGGSSSNSTQTQPQSQSQSNNDQITEIQILSGPPLASTGLRYNLMRLNSTRDVDPALITPPILMTRKHPGPRAPPQFLTDENGVIVGRYQLDSSGKHVLDEDGQPIIERKKESNMDMSLVGGAPEGSDGLGSARGGARKGAVGGGRGRRSTREVFHQDIEVIRLRREEALPWVLEAKNPQEKPSQPETWVGRMMEPSALPTVLLLNDGTSPSFTLIPLGRSYRFEPSRPFKVMDADEANRYFENQAKYKVHDRWGARQEDAGSGGVNGSVSGNAIGGGGIDRPQMRGFSQLRHADRASRMEQQIRANKGTLAVPRVKKERFEDDYRREKRNLGRGLEGGVDEELDYDVNDDFQDDEDLNTFYHNEEEEEERRLHEERQKREYRLANANVGDRPQIESGEDDEDEDDLFGGGSSSKSKLTSEGRKLRKVMRKRNGEDQDDMYDSSDSDWDDSEDEEDDKDKEKKPDGTDSKLASGPSERPSRPPSRGPGGRSTASPSRRTAPPTPDRASSALPGSGSALLAQRAASRGGSPRRSRAGSPLGSNSGGVGDGGVSGRGASPDLAGLNLPGGSGRAASPMGREGSPAPSMNGSRGVSGTPGSGCDNGKSKLKPGKRKTTSESPLRESSAVPSSSKRKPEDSPTPSLVDSDAERKKKKRSASATPTPATGSATTGPGGRGSTPTSTSTAGGLGGEDFFPGMITRSDVVTWFRSQGKSVVPMQDVINAFAKRIAGSGEWKMKNQKVFLDHVKAITERDPSGPKLLRVKKDFM